MQRENKNVDLQLYYAVESSWDNADRVILPKTKKQQKNILERGLLDQTNKLLSLTLLPKIRMSKFFVNFMKTLMYI